MTNSTVKTDRIALLVIDVQMAFKHRDESGADRTTPDAETNIAELLSMFRERQWPLFHIHHHSTEAESPFRPELAGAKVQPFAEPLASETVYVKHVNSAFIGTGLEQDLRDKGIEQLVVCGATANHCVETTTRMAGNLGFEVFYVRDAVWAYGNTGPDGKVHSADDVLSMTLSNLQGEFAQVVSAAQVREMVV